MWENVLAPERDGDKQLWTRNERLTLMRCVAQSTVGRRPVNWEEVARALGVSYTCNTTRWLKLALFLAEHTLTNGGILQIYRNVPSESVDGE